MSQAFRRRPIYCASLVLGRASVGLWRLQNKFHLPTNRTRQGPSWSCTALDSLSSSTGRGCQGKRRHSGSFSTSTRPCRVIMCPSASSRISVGIPGQEVRGGEDDARQKTWEEGIKWVRAQSIFLWSGFGHFHILREKSLFLIHTFPHILSLALRIWAANNRSPS